MGDRFQGFLFILNIFRKAGGWVIPFTFPCISWELEVDIWDVFGASSIFIFLNFL